MSVLDSLPLVDEFGDDAPVELQARAVGLVLSDDIEPGIRRVRRGRGFSFHEPDGTLLVDAHGTGAITDAYDDEPGSVDHLDPDERALLRFLDGR